MPAVPCEHLVLLIPVEDVDMLPQQAFREAIQIPAQADEVAVGEVNSAEAARFFPIERFLIVNAILLLWLPLLVVLWVLRLDVAAFGMTPGELRRNRQEQNSL